MTPKISLIIPIYNAAAFLQACLDSVAAQTAFADTQVLLIDDGSADASPQLCDAFAAQYANVTVLHRANAGVSAARNAGLDAATGKYVAFADADDLLYPEMLEKLYDAAEKTGAQMTFCAFEHPYPDRQVTIRYPFAENVLLDKAAIRKHVAPFMIRDESLNALWNKLFLRSVIEDGGVRMTAGKKYAEDKEFILRYLAAADGVCYVPYVGYYYRYVDTGAIQKPRTDYGEQLAEQYRSDLRCFAALGFSDLEFRKQGAECWGCKIAGAVSFANEKLRGKARRATLRAMLHDEQLQAVLAEILPVQVWQTRFNRMVLFCVRHKSVCGVRCLLGAIKIKVAIFDRLRRT